MKRSVTEEFLKKKNYNTHNQSRGASSGPEGSCYRAHLYFKKKRKVTHIILSKIRKKDWGGGGIGPGQKPTPQRYDPAPSFPAPVCLSGHNKLQEHTDTKLIL